MDEKQIGQMSIQDLKIQVLENKVKILEMVVKILAADTLQYSHEHFGDTHAANFPQHSNKARNSDETKALLEFLED